MSIDMLFTLVASSLLAIISAIVGIAYIRWNRQFSKDFKAFPQRFEQAIPATAEILKVGGAYTSTDFGTTSVAFRMQVNPPFGLPYQAISVWEIKPTHAHDLEGKTIAIKIDKQNPKIIFSNETWGKQPLIREYDEVDFEN